MIASIQALIKTPALKEIVEILERFVTNDKDLRRAQSLAATQFVAFGQGTEASGTILNIPEAQTGANIFSFAVLILDEASGKGRYGIGDNTIGNTLVSGIPRGFPLPSGGYVIEFTGWDTINRLRWTNEPGQTINWTYGAFI